VLCGAVCCSVLQCVAVCCSVLQCVAVCYSVLQCIAVRCSVLQGVAGWRMCGHELIVIELNISTTQGRAFPSIESEFVSRNMELDWVVPIELITRFVLNETRDLQRALSLRVNSRKTERSYNT